MPKNCKYDYIIVTMLLGFYGFALYVICNIKGID